MRRLWLSISRLIARAFGRGTSEQRTAIDRHSEVERRSLTAKQRLQPEQISDREERLALLANAMPQIVYITNNEGSVRFLNERWYQYTGSDRKLSESSHMENFIHPEDWPKIHEKRVRAFEVRETFEGELRLRNRAGEYRWFITRAVPVIQNGEIAEWFGTSTDIHDHKLAARQLEEVNTNLEVSVNERTRELSEAYKFVDSVLENIPNMIFVKEAESLRFVRFNKAGEELLSESRENLLGKNDYDFFPPAEAEYFQNKDKKVLNELKGIDVAEERISTKNGVRVLSTKKIPIYDEHGKPRYLVGISDDITERKRFEEERLQLVQAKLEKQETARITDRLNFLSNASALLGSTLDFETTLTNLTKLSVPALADWCSIQLIQPDGKLKQLAVAHEDPERVKWAWELYNKFPPPEDAPSGPINVVRTGKSEMLENITPKLIKESAVNEEHLAILEGLGFRSYICAPVRVRGEIIGALTLVTTEESKRNYSEADLKLVEELCSRAGIAVENARLYREAQSLNRVKDEFLATLSHELRTPINVIQGHAEILSSEIENMNSSDVKDSLAAIKRNAHLQTQIVSDLLDVSSIVTGKVTFVPQAVSPAEVVVAIAQAVRPAAQSKGVSIEIAVENAPQEIFADPTRLHQMLWNLANNAVKFTPTGGYAKISASANGPFCVFEVSDTGIGIDTEFAPHLFDRFRQADSSMSRKFGGLGLGLSIVKSLAEIHGGVVTAHSDGLGHGSTFAIRLPMKSAQTSNLPPQINRLSEIKEPAAREIRLDGIHILLVEDSADNRELVKRFLKKLGAEVTEVESAAAARLSLASDTPDVIVSDIGMPGENGLEFMQWLRAQTDSSAKVPAIALTAYVRSQEIEEVLKVGFQAHVAKPVSRQQLVSKIAELARA